MLKKVFFLQMFIFGFFSEHIKAQSEFDELPELHIQKITNNLKIPLKIGLLKMNTLELSNLLASKKIDDIRAIGNIVEPLAMLRPGESATHRGLLQGKNMLPVEEILTAEQILHTKNIYFIPLVVYSPIIPQEAYIIQFICFQRHNIETMMALVASQSADFLNGTDLSDVGTYVSRALNEHVTFIANITIGNQGISFTDTDNMLDNGGIDIDLNGVIHEIEKPSINLGETFFPSPEQDEL